MERPGHHCTWPALALTFIFWVCNSTWVMGWFYSFRNLDTTTDNNQNYLHHHAFHSNTHSAGEIAIATNEINSSSFSLYSPMDVPSSIWTREKCTWRFKLCAMEINKQQRPLNVTSFPKCLRQVWYVTRSLCCPFINTKQPKVDSCHSYTPWTGTAFNSLKKHDSTLWFSQTLHF